MPFDGSGTFTPPSAPVFPAIPGTTISSNYYNSVINDLAAGLSNTITRDGQGRPSADIDWNAQDLTNVANLGVTGTATIAGLLTLTAGVTGDLAVAGNITPTGAFRLDANGTWALSGGNPVMTLDTGDTWTYDRTANSYNFAVGGTTRFAVIATGATVTGALTTTGDITLSSGSKFMLDSTAYWQLATPTAPTLAFDANDFFQYNRSANMLAMNIGGSPRLSINATDSTFLGNLRSDTMYPSNTTDWYLSTISGNPLINFDSNDYMNYTRSTNLFQVVIGGAQALGLVSGNASFWGQAAAFDGMGRGSSRLYDSTSTPSGGVNGDFWFQYV